MQKIISSMPRAIPKDVGRFPMLKPPIEPHISQKPASNSITAMKTGNKNLFHLS